ncbi:flavin reductase (DIM6/NTAB) family NADH-FMN oxidoreductase RutF [Rhizobium beringeri]
MTHHKQHMHFDFAKLTERERYKILIGTVIPRPIALVTTVSKDGKPNAGPFSFFNVLTHDPAIVAIGVENYADMRFKDTARNIRETGEFTVHICDDALVDRMEVCAIKFGPEVDELSEAGLATIPGQMVRSPRILAAPAALECRRHTTCRSAPPAKSSSAKCSASMSEAMRSIRRTCTSTSN